MAEIHSISLLRIYKLGLARYEGCVIGIIQNELHEVKTFSLVHESIFNNSETLHCGQMPAL